MKGSFLVSWCFPDFGSSKKLLAVAQNVDDDLTWTCPTNPAPEGFMDRFRAVVEKE